MSEYRHGQPEALHPDAQTVLYEQYGVQDLVPPVTVPLSHYGRPDFTRDTQRAYPFTNENMAGFFNLFDLRGQQVAAIAGSGDFAFNATWQGASGVDAVDSMATACMYGELKMSGLANLSRNDFLAFFIPTDTNPAAHDYPTYQQLRPHIAAQSQRYFDRLIRPDGPHPYLRRRYLFYEKLSAYMSIPLNPYLSSDMAYTETARGLGNVSYHPTDMLTFLEGAAPRAYGAVYLSNISYGMPAEKMEAILQAARKALKPKGTVIDVTFFWDDPSPYAAARKALGARSGLRASSYVVDAGYETLSDSSLLVTLFTKPPRTK